MAFPALHHVLTLGQVQAGLHGTREGEPRNVAGGTSLPGGTHSIALEHSTHWIMQQVGITGKQVTW